MLHLQKIDVPCNRRYLPLLRFLPTHRHQLQCLTYSEIKLLLLLLCRLRLHRLLHSVLTCRQLVVGTRASPLSLVILPVVPLLLLLLGLIQHRLLTTLVKPVCCFNSLLLPVLGPFTCLVLLPLTPHVQFSCRLVGPLLRCSPSSCPVRHGICLVYHIVLSSLETVLRS